DPLPKANVLIGKYAYVVGYPFIDQRLPPEFTTRLLGTTEGRKLLIPGRILGFGVYGPFAGAESLRFTSDISTTGGNSGAPLVELSSGNVLGISLAGVWQGERGKFAYAQPIPEEVREIIASRNRGEDIKVEEPSKPAKSRNRRSQPKFE